MSAIAADVRQTIEAANAEVLQRLVTADPVLVDIAPAGDVVPGLTDKMILHSGPPIQWERMNGAQQGASICMALFEGWAKNPEEAERMLASGDIKLEPNHHHHGVGPMAGSTTRSLPVYVVENKTYGNRAYCRLAENRQQFGDYSAAALELLTRWRDVIAPALRQGIQFMGGMKLKPIVEKALLMGDELHNWPQAASGLFARAIAAPMLQAEVPRQDLVSTFYYMQFNDYLFLPISMAAAKSVAEPAENVEYSTVVTTMARNGTDFGIRVSGLGDEWFTGPAGEVHGLCLPGYSEKDVGRDMGDSTITETVGWGAFVLAGATGFLTLIGGTHEQAKRHNLQMYQITVGTSPYYRIPVLEFKGTPMGIDVRKVVETGIVPVCDSAMAHREPGHPIIGTGLSRPPMECFTKALAAFSRKYELE